ncbi:hypothetical protein B1207_10710 [Legionella quinlivanii]|uniref:Uncharacterized protein n=1 Tax=Legionella quinlivanii TaxID=45073 RepID=A0A364LI87_9GAMM|nr:hypothetical protein B1207_10710 [Legionella quinlivanii]
MESFNKEKTSLPKLEKSRGTAIKLRELCHSRAGGNPFLNWHYSEFRDGSPPSRGGQLNIQLSLNLIAVSNSPLRGERTFKNKDKSMGEL